MEGIMNRVSGFFGSLFVVLMFVGIGGVFAGIAAFQLKEYFESSEWPVTEGNITALSIAQDYDSDSGTTYRANIEYVYRVNEVDYYGSRYQFGGDIWSSDYGRAEAIVDAYEIGQDVLVYYNPEDPNASVLLREVDWLLWLFFAIGAVLFVIGLGVAFASVINGLRGMRKPKVDDLQSGDFLLENEKFKM
jgi:hypothetical protein